MFVVRNQLKASGRDVSLVVKKKKTSKWSDVVKMVDSVQIDLLDIIIHDSSNAITTIFYGVAQYGRIHYHRYGSGGQK